MATRNKVDTLEAYLRWLHEQLTDDWGSRPKSYWTLLNVMFETPFDDIVPMDDNRIVDGYDVRTDFANTHNLNSTFRKAIGPCSFAEVLIGLSRRMAFVAGGRPEGWAWQLLDNLGLTKMSDPLSRRNTAKVREIMDTVIRRTYSPDGSGGFFPLAWPDEDQTKIELWYQMNSYIEELHPEH